MQGLRPESLTDSELRNYVGLYGIENLPPAWLKEIARRFMGQHPTPNHRC